MSTHKSLDKICIIVICLAVVITVLFMNGKAFGLVSNAEVDGDGYTATEFFTVNEINGTWWQNRDVTEITFDGSDIRVNGQGAYALDGSLYIKNGGYYLCEGDLTEGSIYVDAYSSSKVFICFNGVNITRSDDACIRVKQADKVILTLAEGSENSLEMTGSELNEDAADDNVNAAVFTRDDLAINGKGSLTVNGVYKHCICAKDDLSIYEATINLTATADAIHVNEQFRSDADITINAGDDAIHSDKSIVIAGGNIVAEDCYEGLEAVTIDIYDGNITLYPLDDGMNANGGTDSFAMNPGNGGGMRRPGDDTASADEDAQSGADMPVETGSDEDASSEEETYIKVYGGNINIVNSTGNDADGMDSNGDIYIYGGDIRISLTANGMNAAIDYASENNGKCIIDGGTVVACGASGMVEAFDSESGQCAILYNMENTASAGTFVSLRDSDGNTLISYEVPNSFTSVNLSCPGIVRGSEYTLKIGEDEQSISVEEVSTSYGSASGGSGGFGGFGGTNPRERTDSSDESTKSKSDASGEDMPTQSDFSGEDMPTPPDFSGEDMPSFSDSGDGSKPSFFGDGNDDSRDMRGGFDIRDDSDEDETAGFSGTPLSELDASVWYYLAGSATLLLLGLLIAILFRKKK